jgi:hypothetical protein
VHAALHGRRGPTLSLSLLLSWAAQCSLSLSHQIMAPWS